MSKKIMGSGVALITPFKDSQIDSEALRRHVEFQIESGTNFLVPTGTTGESATLSHAEHLEVIKIVLDQSKGRVPVLAGTGSNATQEAIDLTLAAQELGVDGTLQICPYYNKPTQKGLIQHFSAIAEASRLPVVLYNIQGRCGVKLEIDSIIELSQIENITAIKEANASIALVSEIIEKCPDLDVISGEDALTYPMYCLGASAAISVTANVLPQLCSEQWQAVQAGSFARAREIHFELANINRDLFLETNPIPVKTALALMQRCSLEMRLPLCEMETENLKKLQISLKNYQLVK